MYYSASNVIMYFTRPLESFFTFWPATTTPDLNSQFHCWWRKRRRRLPLNILFLVTERHISTGSQSRPPGRICESKWRPQLFSHLQKAKGRPLAAPRNKEDSLQSTISYGRSEYVLWEKWSFIYCPNCEELVSPHRDLRSTYVVWSRFCIQSIGK